VLISFLSMKTRWARRLAFLLAAAVAVLMAILAQPCPAVAKAAGFSDVPEGHPYHVQIETLAQLGVAEGYADGTYQPGSPVTCQQFAAMIAKAMGIAVGEVDVGGIAPDAALTFAELVTMATQAAGRALPTPPDSYRSIWGAFDTVHASVVRIAQYNGLLQGLTPSEKALKSLRPGQAATRGQAAAFLFNVMGTDPDGMCGRFLGDSSDLVSYFRAKTGGNDGRFTVSLPALARYYVLYGDRFGIRADVAWAQMIHETGYGQYGGDVQPAQNNMAGIGATGGGVPGNSFATAELGVIAQYAHLAWYVFTDHVSDAYCVKVEQPADGPIAIPGDPRHFVQADGSPHKGNVVTVYDLSGKWAVGSYYGTALQLISAAINAMCDSSQKGIPRR
jgi:hypothetical protein